MDEFLKIIAKCDADADGNISYTEFLNLAMDHKKLLHKDNLKCTFETLDLDYNGFLSMAELRKAFEAGGNKRTDEFWRNFMKEVDKNGDNQISFDEFEECMQKLFKAC